MSDAYDYDYDTGSYAKNPVQVTRYRQNIQRFRDYGNIGQQSAPVSEGRFKEGIQPSNYQFSPPSAGVQADFANARENRFRDPNTTPLDVSQISSIAYNRLFFNMDRDADDGSSPSTPYAGAPVFETSPTPTATAPTGRGGRPSRVRTPRGGRGRPTAPTASAPTASATPPSPPSTPLISVPPPYRPITAPPSVEPPAPPSAPMSPPPSSTPPERPLPSPRVSPTIEMSATTRERQERARAARRERETAASGSASRPAARSSGSRTTKRPSKSGLGPRGRKTLSRLLPEARGYLE